MLREVFRGIDHDIDILLKRSQPIIQKKMKKIAMLS